MNYSESPGTNLNLKLNLSRLEAEGLACVCRMIDWDLLARYCKIDEQLLGARYALAKVRFALADEGFSVMPNGSNIATV